MAIQTEVWTSDVQKMLYQKSPFLAVAKNFDSLAMNLTVHLPQSYDSASVITKGRSSWPATVTSVTDTIKSFSLESYTTAPIKVPYIDDVQLSYSKRENVLNQFMDDMAETVGKNALHSWAITNTSGTTGTRIRKTTGALEATLSVGATGTRSGLTLADISFAVSVLDTDKISRDNRYMVVPSEMWQAFLVTADGEKVLNADFMNRGNLPEGIVSKVFGLNVMVCPEVVVYDGSQVLKAVGSASASTDNYGAIVFHADSVCKAQETTKFFSQENAPEYYGSIFSSELLFGSSKTRSDEKGIAMIVQQ